MKILAKDIVFETDRLYAVEPSAVIAEKFFENVTSDTKTSIYLSYRTHTDINETIMKLAEWRIRNRSKADTDLTIIIHLKETGEPIGSISIKSSKTDGYIGSYGHAFGSKFWNNGYASEIAKAFIDYWFKSKEKCIAIVAHYSMENAGSGKALQKAGMEFMQASYNCNELSNKDSKPEISGTVQITREQWEKRNN